MFTEKQSADLVKVDDILNAADIEYILIAKKDETPEHGDSYFSATSNFSEENNLYFLRALLELIYSSMMEYFPDDEKPTEDKQNWMKRITEKAITDDVNFSLVDMD